MLLVVAGADVDYREASLVSGVTSCVACRLGTERKLVHEVSVPAAVGSLYKKNGILIMCEAPGADEAQKGVPLVGRAGNLLDVLLYRAGIQREELVLTNRIRCRPPRNRIDDYPDAIAQCDPWVIKELEAYDPSVVILCGNTALKSVFGATASITSLRGTLRQTSDKFPYGSRIWVPTFHPSYALRSGGANSPHALDIVADFKLAKELFENIS